MNTITLTPEDSLVFNRFKVYLNSDLTAAKKELVNLNLATDLLDLTCDSHKITCDNHTLTCDSTIYQDQDNVYDLNDKHELVVSFSNESSGFSSDYGRIYKVYNGSEFVYEFGYNNVITKINYV